MSRSPTPGPRSRRQWGREEAEPSERKRRMRPLPLSGRPWLEETIVLAYPVGALPAKCMISLPGEDPVTPPPKSLRSRPVRGQTRRSSGGGRGRSEGEVGARVVPVARGRPGAAVGGDRGPRARHRPSRDPQRDRRSRPGRAAQPGGAPRGGRRPARERVPARTEAVTVRLAAPGPGLYAVAVYHDENGNRKFDRRWFGLPVEGFGVSNNPKVTLRAPSHAEAAFPVGRGPAGVGISLPY